MNTPVSILAIESSCDDTAAAVLKEGKILANLTANQAIHKAFGGVVPELASRAHMENIWPVVDAALEQAQVSKEELSAIAFTRGPGLIGSLIVGVNFAKGLSLGLDIPMIEVNHMQAHVGAHFIDAPQPEFPFLCLTVSGGHTQLVKVNDFLDMEVIGKSNDDAAGEAFDKSAKLFGLEYPGGPLIDKYAQGGNPLAFTFGKPKVKGLDFSFSGLKTSILYTVQKAQKDQPNFVQDHLADLCASVQHSIVTILLEKLEQAAEETSISHVGIGGGVAANSGLRTRFEALGKEKAWHTYIPKFEYCTDNAGMIAIMGYHKFRAGQFAPTSIEPLARYPL
ncbi:MAG: tRNA (adenosine(37)-N6)-threonylcarbamoyltransferase complex transferase subunit TsaD [Saprospiraceae bacterium]|nr:tRNA (adenosine(37)-N6)-threonylcarbamoyltransferase complex transferase subunit TsaD [Saprospiraceae bacterium]